MASYVSSMKKLMYTLTAYVAVYYAGIVAAVFAFSTIIYSRLWSYTPPKKSVPRPLPPACLNDPELGTHNYVQIQGVKLHYTEKGDSSKPLMLFLHGFPEFWYSWRYQLKHFSKNYWTVAIDMRGFGDSEKPTGVSSYQMKYLVDDVKNVIEALGKDRCVLVAHDWGSLIGWSFVMKYPELVEKYIMINILPPSCVKLSWTQALKSWYCFLFQLPYLPELYLQLNDMQLFDSLFREFCNDDEIEAYKFNFGKPGAFTFALNYYRANFMNILKPKLNSHLTFEESTLPSGLLIYTDNDLYVDTSNFEDACKVVPKLQTGFMRSAGHFLHESKPQETNRLIESFLGVQSAPSQKNTFPSKTATVAEESF